MAQSPAVASTMTKLARSEIAGVSIHTLPIALERAENDHVDFAALNERQVALVLLERIGYPETMRELRLFLGVNHSLTPTVLLGNEIDDQHAVAYMTWLAGFLEDPDANIQKNARILLRWLVANRQQAIAAQPAGLNTLRRVADDPVSSWKNAAVIAYALGVCGTTEDYDRVIHQAELVIEHDRDNADLVAEAMYRMYPPALINALQYFLENAPANSKQFIAGIHLLAKVAEIDDQSFWNTYYDDMDHIVEKVNALVGRNPAVERILDLIEKHLAYSTDEES